MPLFLLGSITVILLKSSFAAGLDYSYIIDAESHYIDSSCVASSGAIILGQGLRYTFQGTPHYKISPYESNFAANALLDDPTSLNLAVVKNWMTWVFNHLNPDGSIYDYYIDKMSGGTELPSIDAYARDGNIPDYDSKDSYAATFLTLARKYAEVVPADTSWLRGYSDQIESIGKALYSCVDDSAHQFSADNNDGLTVAKTDYQVKYTMDNSEVNEGLRDMVWLEENISTYHNAFFYQNLLNNSNTGFSNLWDDAVTTYYVAEGSQAGNWSTFYPDATCQLWPIWCGVISPSSPRAVRLYSTFNSYYPDWQNGNYYDPFPWAALSYVAATMNDSSRVNSYLAYVQGLLNKGQYPANWYNGEAAFTLRAAARMRTVTGVIEAGRQIPTSLKLEQNYPNPFNPTTIIRIYLNQSSMMSLTIYNMLGQLIKVVDQSYKPAGGYSYDVNMGNLASGIYVYALQQGTSVISKKMILVK